MPQTDKNYVSHLSKTKSSLFHEHKQNRLFLVNAADNNKKKRRHFPKNGIR